MTVRRIERWAASLWRYYGRLIERGAPLYLAADRALIGDLSKDLGLGGDPAVALDDFHAACLTLFERENAHATVRDDAFRKVPGTPGSCAICLAVQQVLVVERMLRDSRFTAHSYFPRYRETLKLEDITSRSNPVRGTGFQEIWEALAAEIRAMGGAGPHTITFERGEGPELNRRLPISQALLSAHDLTSILEKAPFLRGVTDQRSIMTALQEVRAALGKRARLLLAAASSHKDLASRICNQVQAFLAWDAAVLSDLRPRPTSVEQPGVLVAYLERADPFSSDVGADRFAVYFRAGDAQLDGEALESAIKNRLSRQGCVLLASDGDAYWEVRRKDDLRPNDAVLAIVEAWCVERFIGMANGRYHVAFARVTSSLSASYGTLLCNVGGRLLVEEIVGRPVPERKLELEGGLMVDARSHRYLAGYAPTAILRQGVRLPVNSAITVDGVLRSAGDFIGEANRQREAKTYLLQLGSDGVECTIVAARPGPSGARPIGYPMLAGGLTPVAAECDPKTPSLRGTCFVGTVRESLLSELDVSLLVNDGARLAMPEKIVAVLLGELRLLGDSNLRANLAARRVASSRSIPVAAVAAGVLKRLSGKSADAYARPRVGCPPGGSRAGGARPTSRVAPAERLPPAEVPPGSAGGCLRPWRPGAERGRHRLGPGEHPDPRVWHPLR